MANYACRNGEGLLALGEAKELEVPMQAQTSRSSGFAVFHEHPVEPYAKAIIIAEASTYGEACEAATAGASIIHVECFRARRRLTILDAEDRKLRIGSRVDDGAGEPHGCVTEFRDCDEDGWKVFAEWPDGTEDLFLTSYADPKKAWVGDTTLRCDDLTLVETGPGEGG